MALRMHDDCLLIHMHIRRCTSPYFFVIFFMFVPADVDLIALCCGLSTSCSCQAQLTSYLFMSARPVSALIVTVHRHLSIRSCMLAA
mmetsp:Transcript_42308/g.108908  ORF Transcript_42308/g.108908 Transcript_42308/m.108908 type:complete len:87 (+) Transcript_42308:1147-1407(+)